MQPYHKINSIFKRDKHGNFIFDEFSIPEVPLFCRNGQRVIVKVKYKDFK